MHDKLESFVTTGWTDLPASIVLPALQFYLSMMRKGWKLLKAEMRLFDHASNTGGSADLVLYRDVISGGSRRRGTRRTITREVCIWDYKHQTGISTDLHGYASLPFVGPVSKLQAALRQTGQYAAMMLRMGLKVKPVEVGVLTLHESNLGLELNEA